MYVRITLITQWQFILLSPTHFLHYYVFSPLLLSVAGCSYRFDVSSSNTSENEDIVEDNCPANCGGIIRFYKWFGKNVRGAPGILKIFENWPSKSIRWRAPLKNLKIESLFNVRAIFMAPKTAEYKLFTLFFKMYKTECKMCCNYIHHFFNEKFFSKGLQRTFSCSKLENYVTFFKILDIDVWNATLDYFFVCQLSMT